MTEANNDTARHGEVLAFVSAKGGTGKTILAASLAYVLIRSGKTVVTVDLDFATRGLSLYMLNGIVESQDILIASENTVVGLFSSDRPASDVKPRIIIRDGLAYHVVLSNQYVFEGGVPDHAVIGITGEGIDSHRYREFVQGLFNSLRRKYDYVIVDTRGGIDLTSATPAAAADGFIVVIEADQLSFHQADGLLKAINATENKRSTFKGFIVNKALFSPDDRGMEAALYQFYRGRTFGVIPADRQVIAAYQKEQIPIEVCPYSDFAFYATKAFKNILSPEHNWEPEEAGKFAALQSGVTRLWRAEARAQQVATRLPYAELGIMVFALLSYVGYRVAITQTPRIAYDALVFGILISLIIASVGVLRATRRRRRSRAIRGATAACLVAFLLSAGYLLAMDVPDQFSQQTLQRRIAQQNEELDRCSMDRFARQELASDLKTQLDFERKDSDRLRKTNTAMQVQVAELLTARAQLNTMTLEVKSLEDQVRQLKAERNRLLKQESESP